MMQRIAVFGRRCQIKKYITDILFDARACVFILGFSLGQSGIRLFNISPNSAGTKKLESTPLRVAESALVTSDVAVKRGVVGCKCPFEGSKRLGYVL